MQIEYSVMEIWVKESKKKETNMLQMKKKTLRILFAHQRRRDLSFHCRVL